MSEAHSIVSIGALKKASALTDAVFLRPVSEPSSLRMVCRSMAVKLSNAASFQVQ
jgi:hypothetical protein